MRPLLLLVFLVSFDQGLLAQEASHRELDSPFASYVEPGFPFLTSTLDARLETPQNLSPRAVILKLGEGRFAAFDTDLLRLACVWEENEHGEWLTMNSMASGSYRKPSQKAPAGQKDLPRPLGTILHSMPPLPGWVPADHELYQDPRDRGSADPSEVGLGPLPPHWGQWKGIRVHDRVPILEYTVGDTRIHERIISSGGTIQRLLEIEPHDQTLTLVLNEGQSLVIPEATESQLHAIEVPSLAHKILDTLPNLPSTPVPSHAWADTTVPTVQEISTAESGYSYDEIALPIPNPWERNVRLSGFDFLSNGDAILCTYDGDVWKASGLASLDGSVTWKRIGSGLHEPLGLLIVKDVIYVHDRNGILRLHDTDGDDVMDVYESFCHLIAQTAETREFAMGFQKKPGGGFYLAKGGQVSGSKGKYNGTILSVSADGTSFDLLATGLRQPYLGVDPASNLLTSSDQQGNWKPATPIYHIQKGKYYGFEPTKKADAVHPAPITAPAIWIPHFVNQSGAAQIWARNTKDLGSLTESLLHLGYNRPELFKVYLDPETNHPQAAISSILAGFSTGIQKAAIHPQTGHLFLSGFKVWGTTGKEISGLYRVRFLGGVDPIPTQLRVGKRGVLMRFASPLDSAAAQNPSLYTVDRWNYQQTHNYGSGNFRLSGEPGQDTVPTGQVYLSSDQQSLFLTIPDQQLCHTLRVSYRPALVGVTTPSVQHAYFTIHELPEIDLTAEGFASNDVDLTPSAPAAFAANTPDPSREIGHQTAVQFGCIACHSIDGKPIKTAGTAGDAQVAVGPSWKGLFGAQRIFTDGTKLKKVDATYLRESIIDPARLVPEGYEMADTGVGMPSYLGVLKDYQIDSLILYIKSLK